MDNLTHSLFALTLARTPLGRNERSSTIALVLASNAPDIDIVATAGGSAKYLEWHRGPTHGLAGVIVLGLAAAAIAWFAGQKPQAARSDPDTRASFMRLWIISMIGVVCHVLMDFPTSYGTRPLSPFVWTWFAQDWEPIIDIYLLAILAAGLWFGRVPGKRGAAANAARSRNATLALGLMMVNYGVRATSHHEALARVHEIFGAQLPGPCTEAAPDLPLERWPRPDASSAASSSQRCLVEIAALPDFLSPFRWRMIAQLSNAFEVRTIDLLDTNERPSSDLRLVAVHYPNIWTPAVFQAAKAPTAQVFLGFSRFPAARSLEAGSGGATVRWTDLRFATDTIANFRARAPNLFTATVQLDAAGKVIREGLGSAR